MKEYYVYIMTNYPRCTVLYTGVTNSLHNRVEQHTQSRGSKSFTEKYNVNRIIYTETYYSIREAIEREKQIKGLSRQKKFSLINGVNPEMEDVLR